MTRALKTATAAQKSILAKMHFGKKLSYDVFDFPGVSPRSFDELAAIGAIGGNYRNGFVLTVAGAKFASKLAA